MSWRRKTPYHGVVLRYHNRPFQSFSLEKNKSIVAEIRVIDIENLDINDPINFGTESCTSYAKLTDKGIVFYGWSSVSRDIPLAYDPGDRSTPFKGGGPNCTRIALRLW